MINCPKCQVPNPDSATACAACGTALVGQQFAQALDQAMGAPPPPSGAPPMPPPTAPLPQGPAVDPFAQVMPVAAPLQPALDPAAAQAEINRFIADQRSRKRTKSFIYFGIVAVVAGVGAFFWWSSAQKEKLVRQAAEFYQTFNKVDDDSIGVFWKCTVRAKDLDVHKATDTLIITDGLEKAFRNFPKGQPDWLRDKCIPMIAGAVGDLEKLKPPTGFGAAVEGVKSSLKEVKTVFERYSATIDKRKQEAADEQDIRNFNGDFHNSANDKESGKSLVYFNILKCAVPDLVKMAKGIKQPPDTQPLVEYIYNTCKGEPVKTANLLRKECFKQRNENTKKTTDFSLVAQRMAGDPRDLEAINDCFRRANAGFAVDEMKAIAEVFVKYHNAREEIKKAVGKLKEQSSGKPSGPAVPKAAPPSP
jgi:hypothetical protein